MWMQQDVGKRNTTAKGNDEQIAPVPRSNR